MLYCMAVAVAYKEAAKEEEAEKKEDEKVEK